jgi:sorbitol-specific phosphotransferase system component IIC
LNFFAHNNFLRLFLGCNNGLETATLPFQNLTVILLIVLYRIALIQDWILPAIAVLLRK